MKARSTPLQRGTKPIKRSRIKPKKRSASEFARIYGSRARVAWVKSLPCCYCAALHTLFAIVAKGDSHNAHTVTGGMGRKAGYDTIVPLCAEHHRRYDQRQFPLDDEATRDALKAHAARIQQMWEAKCAA